MLTSFMLYYIEDYEAVSAYLTKPEDYKPEPNYSDRSVYLLVYSDRHKECEATPTCQDEPKVGKANNRRT
ncbi:5156_t:CDS:1, partial [Dentiscutata erythropus]